MKLILYFKNEYINILTLLNLDLWNLIYTLNTDIIESYTCLFRTETTLEYIFKFIPISFFPPFYTHMLVTQQNNTYTLQSVMNEELKNCIQIITKDDLLSISGSEKNVCVHLEFTLCSDNEMINHIVESKILKIYSRLKDYIENLNPQSQDPLR
jgi:hypothetical protein